MSKIIRISELCCRSGYRDLLYDINWEVRQGDNWAVVGANGSGKTTLLSIIAGFQGQTGGQLEIFGQQYNNENILEIRRKIGWVSGSFFDKIYTTETVLRIVLSGFCGTLGIEGYISDQMVKQAKSILKEWNMADKMDMPFSFLSKGERQNVLIARALVNDPEILILDEPGSGLDVRAREQLLDMLKRFAAGKDKTIIYVTHYPDELLPVFDKCLIMEKGKVFWQGEREKMPAVSWLTDTFGKNAYYPDHEDRMTRKNKEGYENVID